MKAPFKISHSGQGKYAHCPRMFSLHYIEKIRPTGTTSSLIFGSALDAACEDYIINRNVEEATRILDEAWEYAEINGKQTYLPGCTEIQYHANDFGHELLSESDNQYIIEGTVFENARDLYNSGEDKERIAYCNWISLRHKGFLMLNSFINWVDENVEECLGTQVEIALEDGDGNQVTGKADFVIKVFGYDKPILVDLKTAARPYSRNSVKESEQLALYFYYLKNSTSPDMERAAYLVLNKQIKKNRKKTCLKCGHITEGREKTCAQGTKKDRCNGDFLVDITPECVIQYVHDEIDAEFIEANIDKFNKFVDHLIAEEFEENWEGCSNYYGRPCPYFKYCHEDQCMEGLIKKENKDE